MQGEKIIIPFWVIYVSGGIGLFFGILMLILGFVKGKVKLGIIGFISCIIAGFLLSLLGAIATAGIFTYLILRQKPVA